MSTPDSQTAANQFRFLVEATAWRYRNAGLLAYGLALAQLRHDPFYRELIKRKMLPPDGSVLHLGCGQGILLALLATARALDMMPGGVGGAKRTLRGIEADTAQAELARTALGSEAEIMVGDWRREALPACRVAILLDVLCHLEPEEQEAFLNRLTGALEPGGILVVRETDSAAGWRFAATELAERLRALSRGRWQHPRGFRSAKEWRNKLAALGFVVETLNMDRRMPFAQVLLIGRLALS